jgi:L-iditol 2-dehydrogenase
MELRTLADPSPGRGEVVIAVRAAGICGSDIHIYHWDINYAMRPPMVVGHEFSGEIVAVGEDVADWRVGDRVTGEPSVITCGKCRYCRTGSYNMCPDRRVLGYWVDGAFAQYTVIPAHRLHRLPENVDYRAGALVEPLACCVHGVLELTRVRAGDLVAVTGPGAIGMLCAQLAMAEGGRVVVVGTPGDEQRIATALELGAERGLIAGRDDALAELRAMSEGYGADVVLECSGAEKAVDFGLDVVRKQGRFHQVGLFGRPIKVDFEKIAYKEIEVTGSLSQRWTAWKLSLELLRQQKIKVLPLVSDVFPLKDWKTAFEKFESRQGLKIGLDPAGG